MTTNPLLGRFLDSPALVVPRAAARFESDLAAVLRHDHAAAILSASASGNDEAFWFAPDDWRSALRPYVVRDGILQIPVKGVLLYDFPWAFGSFATGYDYIARALDRGLSDGNVRGIGLMVYSYGGQGLGCFDLANRIYAARSLKPIKAYAAMAYSAGYAIASAAQSITMSADSCVGSIGVVMTHVDISRMIESFGEKITFIQFGKHKTDGNSYQSLPDEVKARWQSSCDEMGARFCALVARNRGLDSAAVQATEAECYTANEALKLGLVDVVAPLDDAVTAFTPELSDMDDNDEGVSDMTGSVPATNANSNAAAQAALDARHAEGHAAGKTEGHAAGKTEGLKEGATAERTRIGAILGSEEAKDRGSQAHHLAFETEMNADAAKTLLRKSAQENPATSSDPLSAAMAGVKNPQVGADAAGDQSEDAQAASLAGGIVAAYRGKPGTAAP